MKSGSSNLEIHRNSYILVKISTIFATKFLEHENRANSWKRHDMTEKSYIYKREQRYTSEIIIYFSNFSQWNFNIFEYNFEFMPSLISLSSECQFLVNTAFLLPVRSFSSSLVHPSTKPHPYLRYIYYYSICYYLT